MKTIIGRNKKQIINKGEDEYGVGRNRNLLTITTFSQKEKFVIILKCQLMLIDHYDSVY